MKLTKRCFHLAIVLAVVLGSQVVYAGPFDPVYIPDASLKQAIQYELGLDSPPVDPTEDDMLNLYYLDGYYWGIVDLTGLEFALSLEDLVLEGNFVESLSPLTGLSGLLYLYLLDNPLNQTAYCNHLPTIESNNPSVFIDVDPNPYTCTGFSIPDDNLRAAIKAELGLTEDPCETDMPALTFLNLDCFSCLESEKIVDLTGLEAATNLSFLSLSSHKITDLSPLTGLSNLSLLRVGWNNITDISAISTLTQLTSLQLSANPGIADYTALNSLTQIIDVELSYVDFDAPAILSNWPNLERLSLGGANISDFGFLSSFTSLELLFLDWNNIDDISFLTGMTNIDWLYLAFNDIEDVSILENFALLRFLSLRSNKVQDISPLTSLTAFTSNVDFRTNPLNAQARCYDLATIAANNPAATILFDPDTNPIRQDCSSDLVDLATFVDEWLNINCDAGNNFCNGADMNEDGQVDLRDFAQFASIWLL